MGLDNGAGTGADPDTRDLSLSVRKSLPGPRNEPRGRGGQVAGSVRRTVANMWTVLIILLVAWAVLSIVGFAFEGLLWLGIIGIVLFVGTVIFGLVRRSVARRAS